jgi:hypothetical protein
MTNSKAFYAVFLTLLSAGIIVAAILAAPAVITFTTHLFDGQTARSNR